jgi:hypothetical protein
MDILSKIQEELKAPKNQRNNFGKYNYRSCEDILEGLKAPLKKYECSVILTDDIVMVGNRIYVKSTATLNGIMKDLAGESMQVIAEATAFAREPESQKGMNEAQITGSASSYARKYALNGLFAIDDSKDADTNEHQENANNRPKQNVNDKPVTKVDPKSVVTEITSNIVRSYITSPRFAESIELQDMKKALNDKSLLPNQYLIDELIKEYGSLNA